MTGERGPLGAQQGESEGGDGSGGGGVPHSYRLTARTFKHNQ